MWCNLRRRSLRPKDGDLGRREEMEETSRRDQERVEGHLLGTWLEEKLPRCRSRTRPDTACSSACETELELQMAEKIEYSKATNQRPRIAAPKVSNPQFYSG